MESDGRPVKPHRSGGGLPTVVVVGGCGSLALSVGMAIAASAGVNIVTELDREPYVPTPVETARDREAMEKAEAKRRRKAERRARAVNRG